MLGRFSFDLDEGSESETATLRNYARFGAQMFTFVDTNRAASYDTNLYNACLAFAEDTNSNPILQIHQYGTNAVLIEARHFNYSSETRDLALLVCDRPDTPLWKEPDLLEASDAQDGWLVQGSVPAWKVTDPMFFLVSNLTQQAFFRAIPYSGPQITIAQDLDIAQPRMFGYGKMIYTTVYDDELLRLDTTHVNDP